MAKRHLLYFVAREEDLVFGMGGTARVLTEKGHESIVIVATSPLDSNSNRDTNSYKRGDALRELVGAATTIKYLPNSYGMFQNSEASENEVRNILSDTSFIPDLIFTHSEDSRDELHADVAEVAGRLYPQVMRCGFTSFQRNNSLMSFKPRLFVETSACSNTREKAIALLQSGTGDSQYVERWTAQAEQHRLRFRLGRSGNDLEAFDIRPTGLEKRDLEFFAQLNACACNAFWYQLLEDRPLHIFFEEPVDQRSLPQEEHEPFIHPSRDSHTFASTLTQQFEALMPHAARPTTGFPGAKNARQILRSSDVLLCGGVLANPIVRDSFIHYKGIEWILDHDMPGGAGSRIIRRSGSDKREPTIVKSSAGKGRIAIDYAILSIIRNPEPKHARKSDKRWILGVMGVHAPGTNALFRSLTDPTLLREILDYSQRELLEGGFQVVAQVDTDKEQLSFEWATYGPSKVRNNLSSYESKDPEVCNLL